MSIVAFDGTPACTVLNVNMKRQYTVIPTPRGPINWTATNGLILSSNQDFVVEITAPWIPSDKVGAAMLTAVVSGSPPIPPLVITVVDFQSITAEFTATPSLREDNDTLINRVNVGLGRIGADVRINAKRDMYRFRSTFPSDSSPAFGPKDDLDDILVLLRGRFEQSLKAIVLPEDATVSWEANRNASDNAAISNPPLPSFRTLPSSPKMQMIQLEQNATGAFFIKSTVKCACGLPHTGRIFKLVLIEAKLFRQASSVDQGYFGPQEGLEIDDYRQVVGFIRGTRNALNMDSTLQLLSGGPGADLYLERGREILTASWINNGTGGLHDANVAATYTGGPGRRIFTYEWLAPSVAGVNRPYLNYVPADDALIPRPILDKDEEINKPSELAISRNVAVFGPREGELGYFVQVTAEDLPNQDMPLFFPRPGQTDADIRRDPDRTAPITSLAVRFNFVAALSLSTVSAPWVIGVTQLLPWSISGQWTLQYDTETENFTPTGVVQRMVAMDVIPVNPVQEASEEGVGIEVWPPGTISHIGRATIG